jgi:hypothetical protein
MICVCSSWHVVRKSFFYLAQVAGESLSTYQVHTRGSSGKFSWKMSHVGSARSSNLCYINSKFMYRKGGVDLGLMFYL